MVPLVRIPHRLPPTAPTEIATEKEDVPKRQDDKACKGPEEDETDEEYKPQFITKEGVCQEINLLF